MNTIRKTLYVFGLIVMLGAGCAVQEPTETEEIPATRQAAHNEPAKPLPDDQSTDANGDRCCALCWNRSAYHQLYWVSENCRYHADSWCNEPGRNRGGLRDAKWGSCRDDLP